MHCLSVAWLFKRCYKDGTCSVLGLRCVFELLTCSSFLSNRIPLSLQLMKKNFVSFLSELSSFLGSLCVQELPLAQEYSFIANSCWLHSYSGMTERLKLGFSFLYSEQPLILA